jgi:hypothetical protein
MPNITEQSVLSILRAHQGRANAITGNDIAAKLGHRGKYAYRPVQEVIRGLKRQGHLIVAAVDDEPKGYFIAATAAEWQRYGASFISRATDIWQTARTMEKAAAAQFGAMDSPSRQLELIL